MKKKIDELKKNSWRKRKYIKRYLQSFLMSYVEYRTICLLLIKKEGLASDYAEYAFEVP